MLDDSLQTEDYHLIISCEGTAEEVVIGKLAAADALIFPSERILEATRKRKPRDIQNEFLNYDYEWPVCILRILDSKSEAFKLGPLYKDRFPVRSFYTHPEIEVLAIIKEGEWKNWKKSQKKPSQFCKENLCMSEIKRYTFLEKYWNAESIAVASREYKRLSRLNRGELCLANFIRGSFG